MTTKLSCIWHIEKVLQASLQRVRPQVLASQHDTSPNKVKLPPALGVRRSAQSNADYQTSLALMVGNQLREAPQAFAQALVDHLDASSSTLLKDSFVSKNGFMNFVLNDQWIATHCVHMATQGIQPTQPTNASKSILVDFAAPNLGKKLHVGHLRSSVIGDTLCNLLEFRGHRVTRVSHTGDVGSALATLLVELMDQNVPLNTLNDAQLGQYYESGKQRMAVETDFKAKVDATVIQLQQIGSQPLDPKLQVTWERACQVSREAYAAIFKRLNVQVEERGESTYLRLIPSVIAQLKANALAVESRGALCIFVNGRDKPPMLIQKQDGGFLYATVDLACLHSRIMGFPGVDSTQYDEIVYVTDQSQQLHFQQLFQAAKQAGWTKDGQVKLTHAAFGLVLGKDGTKLSSRNGAFDYLEDLLNEAAAECHRRALSSATTDQNEDLETILQRNRRIGDAAVRYFDLSQQRERNYKFAFDQVLNLKGNTGVYLLYASARLQGILCKTEGLLGRPLTSWEQVLQPHDVADLLAQASIDWHPTERSLALLLCQFDDEVAITMAQLYPHYLCDYLYRVVSQFHAFYEKCRVLNDPKQDSRLVLCAATDAILRRGLQLLGIPTVQRM